FGVGLGLLDGEKEVVVDTASRFSALLHPTTKAHARDAYKGACRVVVRAAGDDLAEFALQLRRQLGVSSGHFFTFFAPPCYRNHDNGQMPARPPMPSFKNITIRVS